MTNEIYFIINYPRDSEENEKNIYFEKKGIKPKCIFVQCVPTKKKFNYKKVFKFESTQEERYKLEFSINKEDRYIISFNAKNKTFIYDVTLEKGLNIINYKTKISQNRMDYREKMEFFIKALVKNNEEDKKDTLFKDTIDLYSAKKRFNLLIPLFVEIYNKKDLCLLLLKNFELAEDKSQIDKEDYLSDYSSQINTILSEAPNIITDNNYNTIDFYGIILCYLNYYDEENYSKLIKNLYEEQPNNLFDIMLKYSSHFSSPKKLGFDFFNKFMKFSLEKNDIAKFKIGLKYIKDIKTFINIIQNNLEDIFDIYNNVEDENQMIKIDEYVDFKKTEKKEEEKNSKDENNKNYSDSVNEEIIPIYIQNLKLIVDSLEEKNKIFINFTNNFWKYLLYNYNEITTNNIKICSELRQIFIKYYNLIKDNDSLKNSKLRKEVTEFRTPDGDDFSYELDKIINNFIKTKKNLKPIEKLQLITSFNPYFKKDEYPKRVNPKIFELFDLDSIDEDFIKEFRKLEFELIFIDKLTDYIESITSKIKKIEHIGVVMKLINIKYLMLNDKDKYKYVLIYLGYLKKKNGILKKDVKDLLNTLDEKNNELVVTQKLKLYKDVKIIVDLIFFNFTYEKKILKYKFFDNINKDLPKSLMRLIYQGIISKYIGYKEEKNEQEDEEEEEEEEEEEPEDKKLQEEDKYKDLIDNIFEKIVKEIKDNDDINNIIKIIDILKSEPKGKNNKKNKKLKEKREENLNKFLTKLIDNNLFKHEEFFDLKKIINSLLNFIENEKKLIQTKENIDDEKSITFEEMMEYIYVKLKGELKLGKGEREKFNETSNRKKSDEFISDKLKNKNREKVLNAFLIKFLENNFKKKISDKNEMEKYLQIFYDENIKIRLLHDLIIKKKIEDNGEYYTSIKNLLNGIKEDISNKNIIKKKLEEFFKNDEDTIKGRFELINKVFDKFDPESGLDDLKQQFEKINDAIAMLKETKDNISLYFKESQKKLIIDLKSIIDDSEEQNIKECDEGGKIYDYIEQCKPFKEKVEYIKEVKDFLLFNTIYDSYKYADENNKYVSAKNSMIEIENLIQKKDINELYKAKKEYLDPIILKLKISEKEDKVFIEKLKKIYKIEDKELIDNLTILFKSEKYKYNINSRIFFFDCLNNKNEKWQNEEWNNKLSEYKDLSIKDFDKIKEKLLELKKEDIYDYQTVGDYNKLFNCLYGKKEAIDYLIEKIEKNENIDDLQNKIDPTNTTVKAENIADTKKCIQCIKDMKELADYQKIFLNIRKLNKNKIESFVNYSKNYTKIMELDRFYNSDENIFEEVKSIIENKLTLKIYQDSEKFFYFKKNNEKVEIKMDDLIKIKNKIPPKTESVDVTNNKKENDSFEISNMEKEDSKAKINENIKEKSKTLNIFKDLINNLENINEFMKVLRVKGSSLPIEITIQISNMKDIKYYLGSKEKQLKEIIDFLSDAKKSYISILNKKYIENEIIRLLHGKQFRSMMKYLVHNENIDSILRYILNNTDNSKINEGIKGRKETVRDWLKHEDFNKDSLDSISKYITSLFSNNDMESIDNFYDRIKILSYKDYKGIYLYSCKKNESMEKFIINLFWDKIGKYPIAQNVLITNKETSDEEIQSFFARAILCKYNTLFAVEINESISKYQQSIMNTYIYQYLLIQFKKYKAKNEGKNEGKNEIKKNDTDKYLNSCIVFIYNEENKENEQIKAFLNEIIQLFNAQQFENETFKEFDKSKFANIKIITSEICGLGKSGKIRKETKDKKYYHFPLGGILNKEIIFEKLKNLLEKINKENKNYEKVAIHLDLTDSEEKSVLNEFFFSFLITKFYTNNEKILYIPKGIHIYIEIPNCFENYLEKMSILDIFEREHITFDNMPGYDYPDNIIQQFKNVANIGSNTEIKNFVDKYMKLIGIKRYSFHQINIFIKLFLSQCKRFNSKIDFYYSGKKVTNDIIDHYAKCTKYFINGGFSKLLTGESTIESTINDKDARFKDILTKAYDNDLGDIIFDEPLVFIKKIKDKDKNKDKDKEYTFEEYYIPSRNTEEKDSNEYLNKIKDLLRLPNQVENDEEINGVTYKSLSSIIKEKNNEYVITNDNYKKMILLIYRILADVPVIIMGETGCGKTTLIIKLNQIINNGKKTLEIININPAITDVTLCKIMDEKNKIAQEQNEELWIFFDEINTCSYLSLITEIFINRTYNGKEINKNIRLIGACNPYRIKKCDKEICGLTFSDDNDNDLVYEVNPLPQSLLYYVFSFGSIDQNDEKRYIKSIIENIFPIEEKDNLKKNQKEKTKELEIKKKNKPSEKEKIENYAKEISKLEVEIKMITRELEFHNVTTEAISECHKYLRKYYDYSVVSLREIARFPKLVNFFLDYFRNKNEYLKSTTEPNRINNEKNNKIRSIICSIYLCYYIRLIDDFKRSNFELELKPKLLNLVTYEESKATELLEQIQFEDLKTEIEDRAQEADEGIKKTFINFSGFLNVEQNFLINQVEPENGIGKNTLLKENVFLLFVSLITNIPLIIIGKPGSGKSLSVQLINKSSKGEYSNNKFFKMYSKIIQTYFQGSLSTEAKDVENLFRKVSDKLTFYKRLQEQQKKEGIKNIIKLPISEACFDELGLADRSKNKPLKVLHPKLDFAGKYENESFVGISNYSLDAAKLNRALVSTVPDLDGRKDELSTTAKTIVEGIYPKIKDDNIFEVLSNTYFEYKNILKLIKNLMVYKKYKKYANKIQDSVMDEFSHKEGSNNDDIPSLPEKNKKEDKSKGNFESITSKKEFKNIWKKDNKIKIDFHGNRDFYNLIKGVANSLRNIEELNDKEKIEIIAKYIERNFGGIEYEINIDFNDIPDDISKSVNNLKEILQRYGDIKKRIILNSIFLFKELYNIEHDKIYKDNKNVKLKIDVNDIKKYNLSKDINDNINEINSRYLLLEIEPSLTSLIVQNIKLENPLKEGKIKLYDGSPFPDDDNNDYRFMKISEIRNDAKDEKLIIIENLDQIHPFLYDLYNMNYEVIDEDKYARICLDSFRELKTLVNDKFRIIIIVDQRDVKKLDLAFLNRLEKMYLSFDNLLDETLSQISTEIINKLSLNETVADYKFNNYCLENLLINCDRPNIQGLVYYYSKKINVYDNKYKKDKNYKELSDEFEKFIINKIYKILPQDIISILSDNNPIKKKYDENKKTYNFLTYLEDMKKFEYKDYKISIIYTFTSIANNIEGLDGEMSFMISKIKSEKEFKNTIDELKKKNENPDKKYIYIKFEQSNSQNIKYITNYILYKYHDDPKFKDDYKYIIIIHINRNFNKEKNSKSKKQKDIIYSLPDINPNINQIFIDNLNGINNISLDTLLNSKQNNKTNIMNSFKNDLKQYEEFDKVLSNFLRDELDKTSYDNELKKNYIKEIINYLNNEDNQEIKDQIIEIAYNIKDNFGDDDDSNLDLIDIIHKKKLINKFSVDIIKCIIDYFKEEVFIKNLKKIFSILEDNNILTTIIDAQKSNLISNEIIKKIVIKYLKDTSMNKINLKCKFSFNYNIPGLYNFFEILSNYINRNISTSYFNTEKMIRKLRENNYNKIDELHQNEESFINIILREISDKNKSISDLIEKISDENLDNEIILKDYITYYLSKHRSNKDNENIYHKIIEFLLKLRFNNENHIIKRKDYISNQFIKIIWIETNTNYIINILKIVDEAKIIFDNDENKLYEMIQDLYNFRNIKYITNKLKNLEVTNEVNECYYILLAIICYCITYENISKENLSQYHSKLIEINKVLQYLNDDLLIFLNEMYIIDELIKVIEIFRKINNIEKINYLKNKLRDNAEIIQKYNDTEDLSQNLINNFDAIYKSIIKDKDIYKDDSDYFDKLRYILFKEIKKNNNDEYRANILGKLLENNEMVKKSNNIFQILLKNHLTMDHLKEKNENINTKFNKEDIIIQKIEDKLKNNIILEETLLYLFEKNSLNYLKKRVYLDEEPFKILKDCIDYLEQYYNNTKNPDNIKIKSKDFCKLFCLGYIKTYCYTMFNNDKPYCKKPEQIINQFNNQKSNIYKIIRLYVYKILYNNYKFEYFKDEKNIKKLGINRLINYNDFIKANEIANFIIEYKVKTLKEDDFKFFIEEFKNSENELFKNKIKAKNFDIKKSGIDNFYMASYNIILVKLLTSNTDIINNFYENVCKPLFDGKDVMKIIDLLYNLETFNKIRDKYNINRDIKKPLLYGFRYCLNAFSISVNDDTNKGLYYYLYDNNKKDNLKKNYYPGNDTKLNLVFTQIIDHFKNKPEEGCFVCLCDKLFYHSVPSGFPGKNELKMKCPHCNKNIGSIKKEDKIVAVKRNAGTFSRENKYIRIFKDEKEIEDNKKRLDEIDYMTLDEFKKKYMKPYFKNETGILMTDKNNFRNDQKVVRNLSQITYRLLNYILYSHLFFAKLLTKKSYFDDYKPKDMKWEEILKESWKRLEKELINIKIDSIEKFMNYIFVYLFPILNKIECIDQYEKLIEIEDKLESEIQKLIKDFEKDSKDFIIDGDENSFINLLTEKFGPEQYKENFEKYPFYEFFYYTNYLDDKYLLEKIKGEDENKYSVLKMYLDNRINSKLDKNKNKDFFDNIYIFNNALNMINQEYSNKISKEDAEKIILKDTDIYKENSELFDKFIEFYKNVNLEEIKHKLNLTKDNKLCDFFIHDDNKYGKNYEIIYKYIIKQQNENIRNLFEKKGIYDLSDMNKVNVQQLDENGIFNLNLPKNISFLDIIFNFSYRRMLDLYPNGYNIYREYIINYELIEETITDLLLNNKQLLNESDEKNETITKFIYNNELFSNQISNYITTLKTKYKSNISLDDQVILYKFSKENSTIHDYIIKDFLKLIKFLTNYKKENNNEKYIINKESKIEDIIDKVQDISDYFINIFKDNKTLTVDKTTELFDYYLKCIYNDISSEIRNYQEELDDKSLKMIDSFFNKSRNIKKEDLAYSLRLFMTLVLFLESDKEKKIKLNKNNIFHYIIRPPDLWKKDISNDEKYLKDLNELKSMKITISNIIYLYEALGKDIPDDFFNEVESKIEEDEEQKESNPNEINDKPGLNGDNNGDALSGEESWD